jgi:hypothetical protein
MRKKKKFFYFKIKNAKTPMIETPVQMENNILKEKVGNNCKMAVNPFAGK